MWIGVIVFTHQWVFYAINVNRKQSVETKDRIDIEITINSNNFLYLTCIIFLPSHPRCFDSSSVHFRLVYLCSFSQIHCYKHCVWNRWYVLITWDFISCVECYFLWAKLMVLRVVWDTTLGWPMKLSMSLSFETPVHIYRATRGNSPEYLLRQLLVKWTTNQKME